MAAEAAPWSLARWVERLVKLVLVFRVAVLLATVLTVDRLPTDQRAVVALGGILVAALSYIPLRRWDRIESALGRHPLYLAGEVLLATAVLAAAGPRSPFFSFTLGTAVLAGVVYGATGAAVFTLLLVTTYELVVLAGADRDFQLLVGLPTLYPVAAAAGAAARWLLERGVALEDRLGARERELVEDRERARLAREMHDSVAKTLQGISLGAAALPGLLERDPDAALSAARRLSADARTAAAEARGLMTDLRAQDSGLPFGVAVIAEIDELRERTGHDITGRVAAHCELAPGARHELLCVLREALRNVERHAGATSVSVLLEDEEEGVLLEVADDGCGAHATDEEALRAGRHFGIIGMRERAALVGGSFAVQEAPGGGTLVRVHLPSSPAPPREAGHGPNEPLLGVPVVEP